MAVNLTAIQNDLVDLIKAHPFSVIVKEVYFEMMDRERILNNMPLFNVRLTEAEWELRSIPNGDYVFANYEIEIGTYSLKHVGEAAIVRETMFQEFADLIKNNKQFNDQISTSRIQGTVRLESGTPEGQSGFIAAMTIPLVVEFEQE